MLDLPSSALDQVQVLADWVETHLPHSIAWRAVAVRFGRCVDRRGLKGGSAWSCLYRPEEEAWPRRASRHATPPYGSHRRSGESFICVSSRSAEDIPSASMARCSVERQLTGSRCRRIRCSSWQMLVGDTVVAADDVQLKADSKTGRLFEKIVEASLQGLINGKVVRFGWPRDAGWPTSIDDRIKHLAERLELETENLVGKTHPNEKDRGLDVVAQLRFGDGGAGSVILLTQCAVGNAWKGKIGEPSLNHWRDIYKWNGQLLRTIAVPWRLSAEFDVTRTHRLFDAIVLDRPRLSAGKPDRF